MIWTECIPCFEEAEVIILSAPIFFYGVPAQLKALVDRSQAMWSKRRLEKDSRAAKTV